MKRAGARKPIEILLVEDRKSDVRRAVEALKSARILSRMHVVPDGMEALAYLQHRGRYAAASPPDVVLIALNVPKMDGRELLQEISHDETIRAAVIIVSGAKGERVAQYVRAGALDYVTKGNLAQLGAAVEAALAMRLSLKRLSPRQFEVFRLIANGHSTRGIAQRLKLSVKTVEAHRAAVLQRLELRNVAELVRYAIWTGLATTPP